MAIIEQSTHTGKLCIGNMKFPCSILSDGTRILTQSNFMLCMGMYYSGWISKKSKSSAETPHFLAYKTLEPFISKHLPDLQSVSVKYRTERGNIANGIKAEMIPKICEIWLDAEEYAQLGPRQKLVAQKAKTLMRALAHIGITALVDEATGYQNNRPKNALQTLLDLYLSKEFATWVKKFPDEFYKEIFRLKGWDTNKISPNKRPGTVGRYTNDLIYDRLAPGILDELRSRQNDKKYIRYHQFLTDELGHPALSQHMHTVIAFMKVSDNWDNFKSMLDKVLPKKDAQLLLEEAT